MTTGSDVGGPRATWVLVVEDHPQLATYLQLELDGGSLGPGREAQVLQATDLAGALERLRDQPIDLVLLDLALPDSSGLRTLLRVVEAARDIPVVILTGTQKPEIGEEAIRAGAHDVLFKGTFAAEDLWRTLRYAVARHQVYLERMDLVARRRGYERELDRLDELGQPRARIASGTFGSAPLRETVPDGFAKLAERYERLIVRSVEQRGLEVDHRVSDHARDLASELGRLRATPKDVVDVHVAAVKRSTENQPHKRANALVDAARLLLVEVLGQVTSYYRTQAFGRVPAGGRPPSADVESLS